MESCLQDFASALTPSAEQSRGYQSIFNNVVQMLHLSSYRVDRVRAGGSFGKGTGTSHRMDLDITFFLNGFEPPFADCLTEIQVLISQTFGISMQRIKMTDCSVRFWTYSDDIGKDVKVDLLPAVNFVMGNSKDICGEQQKRALHEIQKSRTDQRMFRSGFTEAAVEFVKNQSLEVRQLVRLAKFWKDSVYFEEKVTGVSSTIELIAVHVGIRVESHSRYFSMVKAFESFLKTMTNIANERITFTHQTLRGKCRTFYSDHEIPRYVSSNTPLILDPVNPRNNRLYSRYIKDFFVKVLAVKAMESLSVFDRARNCVNSDYCPYLTLTVLWPGPFDCLVTIPGIIETPAFISCKQSFNSRITKVRLTKYSSVSSSEDNWAKFLQASLEYISFISVRLSLDIDRVVKEFFTNATRKQFSQFQTEPSFYQHELTIATGNGSVIQIFIRWRKDDRFESQLGLTTVAIPKPAHVSNPVVQSLSQPYFGISTHPQTSSRHEAVNRWDFGYDERNYHSTSSNVSSSNHPTTHVQSVKPREATSRGHVVAVPRFNPPPVQQQQATFPRSQAYVPTSRAGNPASRSAPQRPYVYNGRPADSEESGCFSCKNCTIL